MRILMVAGGTGGHIYPALALAEALKKDNVDNEIHFVGTNDRMESKVIPEEGYPFTGLDVVGTNGNVFHKIHSVILLKKAEKTCRQIIQDFKPDIVIGFGNYISVPVVLTAHKLHIPTLIHEQNSSPGKANKLLSKYVDGIIGCYEQNKEQFPPSKTRILGNPRASLASNVVADSKVVEQFGLDAAKPLVTIVMGSLGSESVNNILVEACKEFASKSYQVIVTTGKNNFDDFKFKSTQSVKIVPYIDGLQTMANATICVCRAGATTLAELLALKKPSIIIPSPYVPNNHQVKNAMALANAKACIMIEEKDLTPNKLVQTIDSLISDQKALKAMSDAACELSTVNASDDIIKWMKDLIK